jgi:hypothetical protein
LENPEDKSDGVKKVAACVMDNCNTNFAALGWLLGKPS